MRDRHPTDVCAGRFASSCEGRVRGVRGMLERLEELAGHVEFSSEPGDGFHIAAFMPADASHRERESAPTP